MSTSVGQAILATLESDLATIGGPSFISFLQTLQAAKGNILLQQAAILQFVASAPNLGIQLEVEVEQQLLAWVIAKVQSYKAPVAG